MNSETFDIVSIGEAYKLTRKHYSEWKEIWAAVQNSVNIFGEADEYHNYAVTVAKLDDNYTAFQIAEMGLGQYPYNTDLLADAVFYGSKCAQYDACERHVKTLLSRPMSTWTWRAFSFLIDYLRDRRDWTESETTITDGLEKVLGIAQKYQQYFPKEEKSYLAEYETRLLLSNTEKDKNDFNKASKHEEEAVAVLKRAIDSGKFSAVQCSLRYADILFEQQKYHEVIDTCKRALEFGEDVSSVRLGYFMYLSAQSKEILAYQTGDFTNPDRIYEIYSEYTAALAEISPNYQSNIAVRAKILEARSGLAAPTAIVDSQ